MWRHFMTTVCDYFLYVVIESKNVAYTKQNDNNQSKHILHLISGAGDSTCSRNQTMNTIPLYMSQF